MYETGSARRLLRGLEQRSRKLLLCALFLMVGSRKLFAADLSARIAAQDAKLGKTPGAIVLDTPGRIGAPVTLHRGHELVIKTSIDWAATVLMESSTAITCTPQASLTANIPSLNVAQLQGAMLVAKQASGVRVQGCRVRSTTESVLLLGVAVSDVLMDENQVTGLDLLVTSGPSASNQRLRLDKNTVTGGPAGSKNAGVQLGNAEDVTVSNNVFTSLIHGAMWWGGDSAVAGMGPANVVAAGKMLFTGNQCKDIQGACVWGSMGHDIEIRGNSADGCGDVCFDTEGGLRTQIIENTAVHCQNGCAGVFFFTQETTIARNHFHAQAPGGGLIFIKNSSQDPLRHDRLVIANNDLRCEPAICWVVYQEAAGGVRFEGNEVVNGKWLPVGYARSVVVARNHLVYSKALRSGAAMAMPGMVGGTALEVVGNRIESNVPQPADSMCFAASWTDYNATDTHLISGNVCGGKAPFPIGLSVVSSGQNQGVLGVWILGGNQFSGGRMHHPAGPPNERFFDLGECGSTGCTVNQDAVSAVKSLPGCSGRAPSAAKGTIPVCLGPVRGWGTAALQPQ